MLLSDSLCGNHNPKKSNKIFLYKGIEHITGGPGRAPQEQ